MSLIAIVDENDNVIGAKERTAREPHDIYRVAALWLTNSRGEVLMAQRSPKKRNEPGVWGPAVAGTVEAGETYETNIVKEIGEEIGLHVKLEDLTRGPHMRNTHPDRTYFTQWFLLTRDVELSELTPEKDAVGEIRWFRPSELRALFEAHPERFTRSAGKWLPDFLK